jgi:hypothetical protein
MMRLPNWTPPVDAAPATRSLFEGHMVKGPDGNSVSVVVAATRVLLVKTVLVVAPVTVPNKNPTSEAPITRATTITPTTLGLLPI